MKTLATLTLAVALKVTEVAAAYAMAVLFFTAAICAGLGALNLLLGNPIASGMVPWPTTLISAGAFTFWTYWADPATAEAVAGTGDREVG